SVRRNAGDLLRSRRDRGNIRHSTHCVRAKLGKRIPDYVVRFWMLWQRNNYSARSDNPRLFASNFGDCVAQELLVVQSDIGNDRKDWIDYISCIESPSHADF